MNMTRKRNEADGKSRGYRLCLLLAGILLVSAVLLSGCGASKTAEPDGGAESLPASETAAADVADACVIAADDFSNLQLSDPTVPVYDRYTLSERRAKGLTTVMPAILDILKENGVHATFYVTGQHAELHPDVLQRIYAEHHAIGNHSYDHDYKKLYTSPDAFLSEMERTDEIIHGILGVRPLILRAPGGVIGHFTKAYEPALKASGYVEHDWNVSSADAAPNHPVAQDFIDNIDGQTDQPVAAHAAIILMHCSEGHEETVKALPEIIRILKAKGYTFGVVTPMTPQPW